MNKLIDKLNDKIIIRFTLVGILISACFCVWELLYSLEIIENNSVHKMYPILKTLVAPFSQTFISTFHFKFAPLLFLGLFATGLYLFYKSRENVRILRFCISVYLLTKFSFLFAVLLSIIFNPSVQHFNPVYIIGVLIQLYWAAVFYSILQYLSHNMIISIDNSHPDFIICEPATRIKRAINLLIDSILLIFTFGLVYLNFLVYELGWIVYSTQWMQSSEVNEKTIMLVTVLASRFTYFLFFEVALGTSPAKYLTQTRLVTEEGEKTTIGQRLIRTLCRFIPFDALSFFGAVGWHDRFSETIVVDEKFVGK